MKTTDQKKKPAAPKWLLEEQGITQRQWRRRKRQQVKDLIRAFDNFRLGCAYAPHVYDGMIGRIGDDLNALKKALSVKEWGR